MWAEASADALRNAANGVSSSTKVLSGQRIHERNDFLFSTRFRLFALRILHTKNWSRLSVNKSCLPTQMTVGMGRGPESSPDY